LREVHPRIEAAGAALVGVVCQNPARVKGYVDRNPLPFPMIADVDRELVKLWGVHHLLGLDAFNIARPSSFVVDGAGVIRYAFVASDQTQAGDLDAILAAVRSPSGPGHSSNVDP
jgi:peroxiredoxin